MISTTYYAGGYIANAPAKNKAEEYDTGPSTYTRWSAAGVVLEQRALTSAEVAAFTAAETANTALANGGIIRSRAATALGTNATFLAIASPTTAQVTAQAKALTRQVDGIIRLLLNQLDSIADS